jgi:3-deoxy-D-manno-octulosonate 8-phosphate phosphatase (KDO 8-P phosphatase)
MELNSKPIPERIRLVLTDCDGVLTDGGVYYGENGEEQKRFHIRDGMGVKLLQKAGFEVGIVTGESSPSVAKRAEKLSITELHLGAKEKLPIVEAIRNRLGLEWAEVAYIGDDVNDLEVLKCVGFAGCPNDAVAAVKECVHQILEEKGGQGAFREFAEMILSSKVQG